MELSPVFKDINRLRNGIKALALEALQVRCRVTSQQWVAERREAMSMFSVLTYEQLND